MSGLDLGLRGRRALVTGGSRGVGRATALQLARAGVHVGISCHRRSDEARRVVESVRALGVRGWAEEGDLADRRVVDRLYSRVDEEFGGLDIFIGNAGIWPAADVPLAEMEDERWHTTVAVNLDSIFFTTRAALQRMSDDGRVVLVSSTAGQRGEAFHSDYAATKGALISLVKGLCVEVGRRGITVNAVAPGWIDTEMSAVPLGGAGRAAIDEAIPLGRVAAAEDVAGPIVMLCSALARHITGEILNVNGGAVLVG